MSTIYNVVPVSTDSTASIAWGTSVGNYVTFQVSDHKEVDNSRNGRRETRDIGAKLYFSYVKSKMGKTEKERFKKNAQKLQTLIKQANDINQIGLAEQLGKRLQVIVAEMEMSIYGIDKWVDQFHIYKFKEAVKDRTIDFVSIKNFPRIIPNSVSRKITKLQKAGIFDEFWILFNNPKKEVVKTIEQEKDPIVFGRLLSMPDRYYFVADWVDEYCDLTLDQFVEEIKKIDKDYLPTELPEIDEAFIKTTVRDVRAKLGSQAIASTVPMDKSTSSEVNPKKSLWSRIKAWFV